MRKFHFLKKSLGYAEKKLLHLFIDNYYKYINNPLDTLPFRHIARFWRRVVKIYKIFVFHYNITVNEADNSYFCILLCNELITICTSPLAISLLFSYSSVRKLCVLLGRRKHCLSHFISHLPTYEYLMEHKNPRRKSNSCVKHLDYLWRFWWDEWYPKWKTWWRFTMDSETKLYTHENWMLLHKNWMMEVM